MSNEISNLPAQLQGLATSLTAAVVESDVGSGGDLYAKMTKTGEFVYGADHTEIQEGSHWAVNPMGFQHGWTCWGTEAHGTGGKNVGEVMVNATAPMPLEHNLPDAKGNWAKANAIQLRCMNGDDKGIQILFKTNSVGGRKAYAKLLQSLVAKLQAGDTECVPIVECLSDSYKHSKYGKIYTPDFHVVAWTTMDATDGSGDTSAIASDTQEADDQAEPATATPSRRRRRVSA